MRVVQDTDVDRRVRETDFPDEAAEVEGEGGEEAGLGLRKVYCDSCRVFRGGKGAVRGLSRGRRGWTGKGGREGECRAVGEAGALFPEGKETLYITGWRRKRTMRAKEGFVHVDGGRHFSVELLTQYTTDDSVWLLLSPFFIFL